MWHLRKCLWAQLHNYPEYQEWEAFAVEDGYVYFKKWVSPFDELPEHSEVEQANQEGLPT